MIGIAVEFLENTSKDVGLQSTIATALLTYAIHRFDTRPSRRAVRINERAAPVKHIADPR
jgi:hypothetical protein